MGKQAQSKTLSVGEYARARKIHRSLVYRLIKQGRITTLPNGKLDPERADVERARSTRPRVSARPSPSRHDDGRTDPYRTARTVNETYKAKTTKLEYERMTGKLVEADKVMEAAEKAFSNCRVRLRGLARSMAPILAANIHPSEIEKMLGDAIDGALEGLSTDVFN
jgi:hypothetical protein